VDEDVADHVGTPVPDVRLAVGALTRAHQISAAPAGLHGVLERHRMIS
jgi:hypothetical protein